MKILCCLVLIVCRVYGLALLAWLVGKLDVKKRRAKMNVQNIEEVQKIVDILINADAVMCAPIFAAQHYGSNTLYEIPNKGENCCG